MIFACAPKLCHHVFQEAEDGWQGGGLSPDESGDDGPESFHDACGLTGNPGGSFAGLCPEYGF